MPAQPNGLSLRVEALEDRTTPSVNVYNGPGTGAALVATYDGTTALYDAANAASTFDGYDLRLTTVSMPTTGYAAIAIPKSLRLTNPNADINPVTSPGARASEVVIDTSAQPLSIASGKTVTIEGLAFTRPSGLGALTVFADNYAVTFRRNIVTNQAPTYRAVYVSTADAKNGIGYTSALITENRITDNVNSGTAAIRISTGSNAVVSNNVITGVRNGVQLFSTASYGARNPVVTNNYISQTTNEGIDVGDNVLNPFVSYNTLTSTNTTFTAGLGAIRIRAAGSSTSIGPSGNVTIASNYIAAPVGPSGTASVGVTISSGTFPAVTSLNIYRNVIIGGTKSVDTGSVDDATVDLSGNYFGSTTAAGVAARVTGTRAYKVNSYLAGATNQISGFLTANSGTYGFIPATTVPMRVPSPSTGSVSGLIQSGVDQAIDGMTVQVATGAYPGPVMIVNRTLTITGTFTGQAANTVTITGKLTATATAANKFLTLNDLTIPGTTGTSTAPSVTGYAGLTIGTTYAGGQPSYTISGTQFQRTNDQTISELKLSNVGALTVNSKSATSAYEVTLPPSTGPTITLNGSGSDTLVVIGDDPNMIVAPDYSNANVPNGSFTSGSTAALYWTGMSLVLFQDSGYVAS